MLIRIRFTDGAFGVVDAQELDRLIQHGGVAAFRRSEGWVRIGHDSIRQGRTDRRKLGTLINTYI